MAGVFLDSDSDKAIKLISSIGGPSVEQRDIEWANYLDAGKLLLGWLSDQISGDDESNPDAALISHHNETDDGNDSRDAELLAIAVAMRDSTLEPKEVIISNDERVSRYLAQSQEIPECHSDYIPPSQSRKHAKFITSETSNVQQEVALFCARISQTKEASNKINNSIKILQRAIYDLNTKLHVSEETLSELSITADTNISETIIGSQELLLELGVLLPHKEKKNTPSHEQAEANLATYEYADLEAARNILWKSKGNIATLVENFQESTTNFDQLSQQDASKAADLQIEAGRLQSALNDIESRTRMKANSSSGLRVTLDRDVIAELQAICDTLEKEVSLRDKGQSDASGGSALDNLLSELHEGYVADKKSAKSQREPQTIYDQLRQAWALDQASILRLHEEALDEALGALNSALVPLERVYSSLSHVARCIQEAEAVLEAYAEELGDIYLDSPQSKGKEDQSKRNAVTEEAQDEINDLEMEQRLRDVLNDCKDRRPADAGPLVLLTREDILAELHSLKARSARVEGSEKSWADAVTQKYSIRPIHPLLPQIYAHAPTNTSPPFAFPAHVRALEARARNRAAELHGLAQAVDGEVREMFAKEGNSKRLDAFVEKWAGIGEKED